MLRVRRTPVGLFAALIALAIQLAIGALVPTLARPVAGLALAGGADQTAAAPICHSEDRSASPGSDTPAPVPPCLACPLCALVHEPVLALPVTPPTLAGPVQVAVSRPEQPPPGTAPPAIDWPPNQPRAPPPIA